VDSLLNAQIGILLSERASLLKTTSIGENDSKASIQPKTAEEWKKELDIFFNLETINKPTNRVVYRREDNLTDPTSNLKILVFTAQEEAPVGFLKIYYEGSVEHVRKIEASFADENPMYKSHRELALEFTEVRMRPLLSSYALRGGQKVFLGDSVRYEVHGKVLFTVGNGKTEAN
jgi:hypothetical protein